MEPAASPPSRAQKKRRPRSPLANKLHKLNKMHERRQLETARQRFALESDEEEAARLVTGPPRLVASKSEGQQATTAHRRRHLQPPSGKRGSKKKSFDSLSSVASYAGEAAIEQGLLTSTTFSSSAVLTDDALAAIARKGKQQLEAVAKRQVMVGRWKRMPHSKPDCQMFESVSKARDQYSVVAKMDLPCSLREIMSVFSTDNAAEFHRSMEAVFGDQYVYGVNVRTVDCTAFVGGGSTAVRSRAQARRASEPAARRARDGSLSAVIPPLHSAKLKLNAVSLMQKQRLVWKQRNMTFLDYLEEKIEAKSVTRVMQTMDMTDEDLEFSSVTLSSPTAASSSQENCYPQQNQHGVDPQYELKGILAGYVVQEDSEEKFTRFFFYATHHHHPPGPHGQTRMPRSAVQLLRAMVNKVCLLETVVLRRRLGYYPLSRLPTSSDEATMASYCATCYIPFGLLRKKYFCRLCGHYTCRKCSDLQDVEKTIGLVEKHRVCVSCVRRVSYCVFNMCAFPPKMESNVSGNSWTSARSQQPTEVADRGEVDYDPPIMDDLASKDIEDIEVVHPNQSAGGALAGFVSDLLHGKDKKQELAVDRRPRLQLTIDDLSTWVPGPLLDGQNTPKESISLLDSFCTSHSSTSSRSRDFPSWLSPSPTGA